MKFYWTDVDGYMLRAPTGFSESEQARSGRCGPNASYLEAIIPDVIMGVSITPACKIHDYSWFVAEDKADKEAADLEFFGNGFRIIRKKSKSRFLCFCRLCIMFRYMLAVLFFAGDLIEYKRKEFNHGE